MADPRPTLEQLERDRIIEALRENHGIAVRAAKKLGISRRSLGRHVKALGIAKEELAGLRGRPEGQPNDQALDMRGNKQARPKGQGRLLQSRIYGTIDYIAKHVFKGDERMVAYARLVAEDGDERFQAFVEAWDQDRQSGLPPAAHDTLATIAKTAGISSIDFCAEVLRACMKRNMEISSMFAALAHPKVIQKNIAEALKSKGLRDREMFLTYTHTLPIPRGSIINVNAQAGAVAGAASAPARGNGESTPLPEFEEMTVTGSKIVREEESADGG